MLDEVIFAVVPEPGGATTVLPVVNGDSLVELVGAFEVRTGRSPSGGYGPLVPGFFNYGDISAYLRGEDNGTWPRPGRAWLLGCDCGEVGCWPLEADIERGPDVVTWRAFAQPHRPSWDYSEFGPFVFARAAYDAAVDDLVRGLSSSRA